MSSGPCACVKSNVPYGPFRRFTCGMRPFKVPADYLRQGATCHNATGTMFPTITPLDPGSTLTGAGNPVLVQSFTHSSRALAFL